MKKRTIVLILLMLILIAAAALFHSHNQYLLLQGEVDAPEVIVTSKAKGRVMERHVERGDDVKQGQLLLTLKALNCKHSMKLREQQETKPKHNLTNL